MDLITPELVAVNVYNVCLQLQQDRTKVPDWQDVALILGTAAVESGFALGQRRGKQATFGIFGLDPNATISTYTDLAFKPHWYDKFSKPQKRKMLTWQIFSEAWLGVGTAPFIPLNTKAIRYLAVHDLRFAATMCKWSYMNLQQEDPNSLSEVAELWHTLHNNDADRFLDDFHDAWTTYECARLMGVVGYE
ncbi:MAG: hypothetical protein ACW99G_01535 [Candidatus Thorarchaeota archaeon]|jgi:hypothetical protein